MSVVRFAAIVLALCLVIPGCGGGSEWTPPPPDSGPIPEEVPSEEDVSTQLLEAYLQQRQAAESDSFRTGAAQISFIFYVADLYCTSEHSDALLELVWREAEAAAADAEAKAREIAATRRWLPSAFAATLSSFRKNQVDSHLRMEVCPLEWTLGVAISSSLVVEYIHDSMRSRLRADGIVP
jgi:hypothetical protein